MSVASVSLAVIGAGVAACALTARLRRLGWQGSIALVEAGRGVGGRSASRRSRHDPSWCLDHGAPFLTLPEGWSADLLEPLLAAGHLSDWPEASRPLGLLDGDGDCRPGRGSLAGEGRLLHGTPAMETLCLGLLALAEAAARPGEPAAGASPPMRLQGVRITGLAPQGDGHWLLCDRDGVPVLRSRWLVLSGTLLAHPRCLPLLDVAEVPLRLAARRLEDPRLEHLLAAVAAQRHDPRLALLCPLEVSQASLWQSLPFAHLELTPMARARWGLERIVLQPQPHGRLGVVAHGRPWELAAAHDPALVAALAQPQADEQRRLVAALSRGLLGCLAAWIPPAALPTPDPLQLMRWGGAFPLAPGLDPETMVCPSSRVALCGDGIAGPGFGRIAGAWQSGEWLAARLLPELPSTGS